MSYGLMGLVLKIRGIFEDNLRKSFLKNTLRPASQLSLGDGFDDQSQVKKSIPKVSPLLTFFIGSSACIPKFRSEGLFRKGRIHIRAKFQD